MIWHRGAGSGDVPVISASARGSAAGRSSATSPGPASAAARPCSHAAAAAASHAGIPCASSPRDHAGQHVARARGREPGRRGGVDRGAAVRRRDHRVRALQQHDRPGPRGGGARGAHASSPGAPNTRVNSPSCGVSTAAAAQRVGIAGEGGEHVGVGDHLRAVRRPAAGTARTRLVRAEARAAHPDLAAFVLQQFGQARLGDDHAGVARRGRRRRRPARRW